MRKYEYTERQTVAMLGRRGFLKVVGVTALAFGVTGYAVVDLLQRRHDVIKARQAGLYRDDKICQKNGLTNSHQNPSVQRFYVDMKTEPVGGLAHDLLHTHYYPRSQLAAMGGKH
ncbi:MAG: iron hydrogenase small subunit [Candidatus Aphodousia sp.]|jgi:hypothetical protein|nr:iron hydrogenase small subunit [Sutterella sp.]MDY2899470.1 iron hydrogenase small subunit [Candidatus Aphodousia sp.]